MAKMMSYARGHAALGGGRLALFGTGKTMNFFLKFVKIIDLIASGVQFPASAVYRVKLTLGKSTLP